MVLHFQIKRSTSDKKNLEWKDTADSEQNEMEKIANLVLVNSKPCLDHAEGHLAVSTLVELGPIYVKVQPNKVRLLVNGASAGALRPQLTQGCKEGGNDV